MSMNKAAEELLKIADEIEVEAAEVTQFVCDKCNHTANLSTINARRKEAAASEGENVVVGEITVNDKIACPACEGVMAYQETEASQPYYYDPDKEAKHSEKTETADQETAESLQTQKEERAQGKHASIDYDSLGRYTK